jgi:flagellar biosynthetic protein FliR
MADSTLLPPLSWASFAGIAGNAAPWLVAVLLMTVRLTIALALSPVLASYGVPALARIVLIVLLAAMSVSGATKLPVIRTGEELLAAAAVEAVLGMLLGLGLQLALGAFSVAGRILDVQIGFGIGSVFDPVSRSSQSVMGSVLGLAGVTLFFASDAHLALARWLSLSLDVLPVGEWPRLDNPMPLLAAGGAMFSFGLSLAASVALALVVADLFIGIAARNMPQVNVFLLGMPLKALIAYLVLALSVRAWAPLTQRVFALAVTLPGAR